MDQRPSFQDTDQPPSPSKWYHNIWVVLFMLFFVLGPLGLPMVWRNPRFSQNVKWLLTLSMVVYTIALIGMTISAFRIAMEHIQQLGVSF